jgi:enolase
MSKPLPITSVSAREVFDSRGVSTIEVEVVAGDGFGRSAAPFGAPGSRGEFEASAYGSLGVAAAVTVVHDEIEPGLLGLDASDLTGCDALLRELDGTASFDRIGGNTSSAVSTAIALAAADALRAPLYAVVAESSDSPVTLPVPLGNIIGGGAHAMGPTPDMQEHLVIPVNATSVREAVALNIRVHNETGRLLAARDARFTGGSDDERAWAADLDDIQALEVIQEAVANIGADGGAKFRMGLDMAADRMWNATTGRYVYQRAGLDLTPAEQLDFVESLVHRFDLGYVEDAFESTDYESFAELRRRVGDGCLVCGDDLLATSVERTANGVRTGSVNAMIIKVNQVGTVTGARETNKFARAHGIATAISHRSGETADAGIAHMGAAWGCSLIKAGVTGGERLAKLNELIRIEDARDGAVGLAPLPAPLASGTEERTRP